MIHFDYVMSAIGMTGLTRYVNKPQIDVVSHYVRTLTKDFVNDILNPKHTKSTFSVLFNAFTEREFSKGLEKYGNLNSDGIYADSGGLQMVTAGKTITDEMKDQIYDTQCYSDYAMCFDVIPLVSVSLLRTRNERSNTGNKVFFAANLKDSAIATGKNIQRQCRVFAEKNAKTKVIVIVQGNTAQDMVLFFENIQNQLSEEDMKHIGGIALADTCMGNKELESIEMLWAGHMIQKIAHPAMLQQVHFLGVGSLPRMAPIINLTKSGFLKFPKISYDSSSHTTCYNYGLMKLNGTCLPLGKVKNKKLTDQWEKIIHLFEAPLTKLSINKDKIYERLFNEKDEWSYSKVYQRALATENADEIGVASIIGLMYALYQVDNFITNVDKMYGKNTSSDVSIRKLLDVKTDDDMKMWMKMNARSVDSGRINREENATSEKKIGLLAHIED
jgi:hypothetical protein